MNKLREYRVRRGLKQAELAQELGVTQASLSRFESGAMRPNLATATRIERLTRGKVKAGSWFEEEQ